MTEEEKKIESLKNHLRSYAWDYDWWGQFGVDYIKNMFADNKKEWIKILQEEWEDRPWWLYKNEQPTLFIKFICKISRDTVKDYLYDTNNQLINIRNSVGFGLDNSVADYLRYFKIEHLGLHSLHDNDFENLISGVRDMISKQIQEKLIYSRLKTIDYRFLILGYDSICDYELIACYVFNKVEQYNKRKFSTND